MTDEELNSSTPILKLNVSPEIITLWMKQNIEKSQNLIQKEFDIMNNTQDNDNMDNEPYHNLISNSINISGKEQKKVFNVFYCSK